MRWRPEKDLFNLREDFNRLFGNFLFNQNFDPLESAGWTPRVDIEETDDEYLIKAEIPGIEKKDVKVTLENNILTICGERREETESKKKNYLRRESAYGSFCRSFNLPHAIDAKKIKASFKDGILNINVPKTEEAKPKQIDIDIN